MTLGEGYDKGYIRVIPVRVMLGEGYEVLYPPTDGP
jgi:hypothetical protein